MSDLERLTQSETQASNYLKYRGKCQEMSEAWIAEHPDYRLVRGFYWDGAWGPQAHWWTVSPTGEIYDPTKLQFPSAGLGLYEEFDGNVMCDECGKDGVYWGEKDPRNTPEFFHSTNYVFCSQRCAFRFVGL